MLRPRRLVRAAQTAGILLLAGLAMSATGQIYSVELLNRKGAPVALDSNSASELRAQFAAELAKKESGLQIVFGKKVVGTLVVRMRLDDDGTATEVTQVGSTIPDSGSVKSLLYTLRSWDFDHVDIPTDAARITFALTFNPSAVDVPPWRYREQVDCADVPRENVSRKQIWDAQAKTCLYIEVPTPYSRKHTLSTFDNTEWNWVYKDIQLCQCSRQVQWKCVDSSAYVKLDEYLRQDSLPEESAVNDLRRDIADSLSSQGFAWLVAFYRHRGSYTNDNSRTVTVGTGSAGPGFRGGTGPSVSFSSMSRSTVQSLVVSVYDLRTGKGVAHHFDKETDFSLELAVQSVVDDLFDKLADVK